MENVVQLAVELLGLDCENHGDIWSPAECCTPRNPASDYESCGFGHYLETFSHIADQGCFASRVTCDSDAETLIGVFDPASSWLLAAGDTLCLANGLECLAGHAADQTGRFHGDKQKVGFADDSRVQKLPWLSPHDVRMLIDDAKHEETFSKRNWEHTFDEADFARPLDAHDPSPTHAHTAGSPAKTPAHLQKPAGRLASSALLLPAAALDARYDGDGMPSWPDEFEHAALCHGTFAVPQALTIRVTSSERTGHKAVSATYSVIPFIEPANQLPLDPALQSQVCLNRAPTHDKGHLLSKYAHRPSPDASLFMHRLKNCLAETDAFESDQENTHFDNHAPQSAATPACQGCAENRNQHSPNAFGHADCRSGLEPGTGPAHADHPPGSQPPLNHRTAPANKRKAFSTHACTRFVAAQPAHHAAHPSQNSIHLNFATKAKRPRKKKKTHTQKTRHDGHIHAAAHATFEYAQHVIKAKACTKINDKQKLETAAYDEQGNRVAGVWYDNTRRLWRVMYLEGDKRKTKGFSPRDYGYLKARDMAVALKFEKMRKNEPFCDAKNRRLQ